MGAFVPPPGQPGPLNKDEFLSASQRGQVTFHLKDVSPPSPLYIRPEEGIRLAVTNSDVNITVLRLNYRLLLADGSLQVGFTELAPTSNRAVSTAFIPLTEGYLLSLVFEIIANTVSTQRGQCFGNCRLVRGSSAVFVTSAILFNGYITNQRPIGWPGGPLESSVDGPGWIHTVQQANPTAGNDWVYTVPTGARQRLISLQATLTTSSAAANRNVSLIVDDGVNLYWSADVGAAVVASTVEAITATGTNAPTGVFPTTQSMVMPPTLVMPAGHRIRSSTGNIQAGDQWSAIWLAIEEWLQQ